MNIEALHVVSDAVTDAELDVLIKRRGLQRASVRTEDASVFRMKLLFLMRDAIDTAHQKLNKDLK